MSSETFETSTMRGNRYRDNYRRCIKTLLFLSTLAVFLSVWIFYLTFFRVQPQYFASSAQGDLFAIQSLSEPVISRDYLLEWASVTVRTAYSLNFSSLQADLHNLSPTFTKSGWNLFMEQLKASKLLQTVKNKKLIVSAVVTGPPVILEAGVLAGHYRWKVQLPLLLTYTSANQQIKRHLIVTMKIIRVPVLRAAQGIRVDSFIVKSAQA